MSAIDFLRDVGKHYRLGTMLAKDTVARRLSSDEGISFTEFSYQILQGIDFHELYLRHGVTLQTGGNGPWGPLSRRRPHPSGRGRVECTSIDDAAHHERPTARSSARPRAAPLWLDADHDGAVQRSTSSGSTRRTTTSCASTEIFTFRSREEIAELEAAVRERPGGAERRSRTLAADVTTLGAGAAATEAVIATS